MKIKLILLSLCVAAVTAQAQYRIINGQVHAISDGTFENLPDKYEVMDIQGHKFICRPYTEISQNYTTQNFKNHGAGTAVHRRYIGEMAVFKNFTGNFPVGSSIVMPLWAVREGQTRVVIPRLGPTEIPAIIYDFGTPYTPPPRPLTPAEIAAKKAAAQKAFEQIHSQAEAGSASSQYSLGVRYLTGYGCETNREEAVRWLNKAAAQGSIEASNKLASLNP